VIRLEQSARHRTRRAAAAERRLRRRIRLLAFAAAAILLSDSVASSQTAPQLRWAGDPEGGAPFVQADPENPEKLVGFDVEIAELIARRLGKQAVFVNVTFASIDQSIERGDADIGLSGIEDTPARRASMATTVPYYEFREVLSVRDADALRLRTLADLKGRRVGTLAGTIAHDILLRAKPELRLEVVTYDDDLHPYSDLVIGRIDAVLLDHVLAERRQRAIPGFTIQPQSVAIGRYVGVLARRNAALRDEIDQILRQAMKDGSLEKIFRRWEVWSDDQARFYARMVSGEPVTVSAGSEAEMAAPAAGWQTARRYLPSLVRASLITVLLSCLSMALAVILGIAIASGRIYGSRFTQGLLTGYVEIMRGTPLLLQLFVLYYGIADLIRLPPFAAALLGLALNYAAYESEIYRSALESVPVGQLEAAWVLGLTRRQTLALVRAPQAFRLALAPMTNDFVALLKDSSLVSVLTVLELTKQTQIFATNTGSWVIPGLLCAVLYLAMSLPLAALARRLERSWKVQTA
jgi:polar amino acid transport system substrate-binding protein